MANKVKIDGISFNLDAIAQMENIEALKAHGAAEHSTSADAIYEEAWKQGQDVKAKLISEPPKLEIEKPKKAKKAE